MIAERFFFLINYSEPSVLFPNRLAFFARMNFIFIGQKLLLTTPNVAPAHVALVQDQAISMEIPAWAIPAWAIPA